MYAGVPSSLGFGVGGTVVFQLSGFYRANMLAFMPTIVVISNTAAKPKNDTGNTRPSMRPPAGARLFAYGRLT